MIKRYQLDLAAEEELTEAVSWYDAQRSGIGEVLVDAVENTLNKLATCSIVGSPVPGLPTSSTLRRVFVPRFPYTVIYLERAMEIRVVAIAHARRAPLYWLARMNNKL